MKVVLYNFLRVSNLTLVPWSKYFLLDSETELEVLKARDLLNYFMELIPCT